MNTTTTTTTTAATTLDPGRHVDLVLAEAVYELLRRLDVLTPEPDLDTSRVERAVNRASDVLTEHADRLPDDVHAALDHALDDIASAVEWDIDATAPPLATSNEAAAGHAARLIDAIGEAGYTLTLTSRARS
jgi:hypothetical protein